MHTVSHPSLCLALLAAHLITLLNQPSQLDSLCQTYHACMPKLHDLY